VWQLEALLLLASREIDGVTNFIYRKKACSLLIPVLCPSVGSEQGQIPLFLEHLSAKSRLPLLFYGSTLIEDLGKVGGRE
jgi:hypothetical protein